MEGDRSARRSSATQTDAASKTGRLVAIDPQLCCQVRGFGQDELPVSVGGKFSRVFGIDESVSREITGQVRQARQGREVNSHGGQRCAPVRHLPFRRTRVVLVFRTAARQVLLAAQQRRICRGESLVARAGIPVAHGGSHLVDQLPAGCGIGGFQISLDSGEYVLVAVTNSRQAGQLLAQFSCLVRGDALHGRGDLGREWTGGHASRSMEDFRFRALRGLE